jgi:hypothetical protein
LELATNLAKREVQTGGDAGFEVDYTISVEDIAHIMWVLRTGLYSRKALAVLREYSSNAWDEHQESGQKDRPIKVHVPTWTNPVFTVRDYGRGLGRDGIDIFAKFGRSTKRGSNEAVGALGIGSKSAFCVGDTFTVTSWHEGTKSIYRSAIGEDNKGKLTLMHEEPCGDETGIEIKVPVPQSMIHEFEREAKGLFRYMRPQPEINLPLPSAPKGLPGGYITSDQYSLGEWVGVMGCVPYRIDIDQIQDELRAEGLYEPLQKLGGTLYIPIGEVDFAANREELQYTKITRAAIVARFKALVQDYIDDALASIKDGQGTGWERRTKAMFLSGGLGFKLPRKYDEWTRRTVALWTKEKGHAPVTFTIHEGKQVPVSSEAAILVKDPTDNRRMKGWSLRNSDVVIIPNDGQTADAAKAELKTCLEKAGLDGVPVYDLSMNRSWYNPDHGNGGRDKTYNAKHKQRTFKMTGMSNYGTLSKNWEQADPPQDEHVYFIIHAFKYRDSTSFYDTVRKDRALAKALGLEFPEEVYGYKTTSKRPVIDADIENGTPYMTWRKQFFADAWTGKRQQQHRDLLWANLFDGMHYRWKDRWQSDHNFAKQLPTIVETLEAKLGDKHLVTRYFARHLEARKTVRTWKQGLEGNLKILAKMFPGRNKRTAPQCHLDRILAAYPMLGLRVASDDDMHIFITHLDLMLGYLAQDGGSTPSSKA